MHLITFTHSLHKGLPFGSFHLFQELSMAASNWNLPFYYQMSYFFNRENDKDKYYCTE